MLKNSESGVYIKLFKLSQKPQKLDKYGRIYIPKLIRDIFRDYQFRILVLDGKIVLDPIRMERGN